MLRNVFELSDFLVILCWSLLLRKRLTNLGQAEDRKRTYKGPRYYRNYNFTEKSSCNYMSIFARENFCKNCVIFDNCDWCYDNCGWLQQFWTFRQSWSHQETVGLQAIITPAVNKQNHSSKNIPLTSSSTSFSSLSSFHLTNLSLTSK